MKRGAGKAKGSAFERETCRFLSLWISNGARKDIFWRTAGSGARNTNARNRGETLAYQGGDIGASDPMAYKFLDKFSVEIKFYRDIRLQALLFGGTSKLPDFWNQCKLDASQEQKEPMLIVKQNNMPVLVCVEPHVYERAMVGTARLARTLDYPHAIISTRLRLACTNAEYFFKYFKPSMLEN